MKIFLLFLLTILVVTAALKKCKLQRILLKEIIDDVNGMRVKKVLVENVITPHNCTHENFCKAGMVLSEFEAEGWQLSRRLTAYSKDTSCNIMASAEQVQFRQLLENIKYCAQKQYKQPCNQKDRSKP